MGQRDITDPATVEALLWSPALAQRAALLRCWRDDVETADLLDTAAVLAHAGFARAAALLRAIAGIEFGHPATLRRGRREDDQPSAIDEVCALARSAPAIDADPAPAPDTPADQDPAPLILAVAAALADADGAARLGALLPAIDAALADLPEDAAQGSADALAATIAARRMRAFLRRHRDLAFAPHGSAALLHAAARLQRGLLGPYGSNIDRLLRDDGDLIALIRAATDTADDAAIDDAGLVRWLAILTARLPAPRIRGIADLLGDLGLGDAARALLDIVVRRTIGDALPDRGLFIVVRDLAIDLGDLAGAIAVQRRLADTFAHEDVELLVLADLEATRGAFDTAIALLAPLGGAAIHPYAARMTALRAGRYDRYRVDRGYSTPPESRQRRARYRRPAHG